MVSLDLLSSLDGLIWLQSGKKVGERFHQHQTTVSRNLKKCSEIFGLSFQKSSGQWLIDGNPQLLNLERKVHQCARFLHKAPLRLDVSFFLDGTLVSPAPNGWLTGRSKRLGTPHSQDLLTTNIVDAWLCPLHEAPSDGKDLTIFHLCQLPLQLLVYPDHPLLKRVDLTLDQVNQYPLEHIPPKAYPGTERVLQSLDFSPLRKTKKQTTQLGTSQQANASTLHLGSVLRHDQDKPKLVALPLRLNVNTGVALVTRREHSATTAIRDLRTDLEQRLKDFQLMHPEVQLIGSTANRTGRADEE